MGIAAGTADEFGGLYNIKNIKMGHDNIWDIHKPYVSNWFQRVYVAEGSGSCLDKVQSLEAV